MKHEKPTLKVVMKPAQIDPASAEVRLARAFDILVQAVREEEEFQAGDNAQICEAGK